MAALLHSESRRLYSWWWDSHVPKNSKWLQENLTDMDAKVKAMIKLIEEDADSFARRAEMYYKKRPELMKLVEEFYRAYRALAERYDHAIVELRHAHRTMAEAFPNQLSGDSPSGHEGVPEMSRAIRALLDLDDLQMDETGLSAAPKHNGDPKQLNPISESQGNIENGQADAQVQALKETLGQIEAEKETLLTRYQQSLEKLSWLEKEFKDIGGLDERASRAEIEVKILKETLAKLEAERDAGLLCYNHCLEKISCLENEVSQAQEDAETESQNLKQELSGLEVEKEARLLQYNHCLEMISILEKRIALAEENARMLNELAEKAETEVKSLRDAIAELKKEKEAAELRYEQCVEMISMMETEVSESQEDVKRLNGEVVMGVANLKGAEEHCYLLERSNQSLQLEAKNLVQKIAVKDQELSTKGFELEKLHTLLEEEKLQFAQVEGNLQALQKLHSQSQEEQKALALELQTKLQMLKDLEVINHDLREDLNRVKDENESLKELNSSSRMNLQDEISCLKEMKEKLEEEVTQQVAQTECLQQEISHLREAMDALNRRYQGLMEQVWSVNLDPDCLGSSVKQLREDNLRLKEVYEKDKAENQVLLENLRDMNSVTEKNLVLERSLSETNGKLEGSRDKVKELQAEKTGLVAEKGILLTQLQLMNEHMQKLSEKNALVENSLSGANVELEGLRVRSRSLEELCEILKTERSNLLSEKSSLVFQLEAVEQRLGNLERRFTRLEEKYTNLEKEKAFTVFQVKELYGHLGIEKQEHACYIQSRESRLVDLENQVYTLREESRLRKRESEEELDNAVNAQVEIFILQKFMEDLEQKNLALLIECQRNAETSKLSNKMISELERENLEQQVEVEFLLDEIEKYRKGVQQVFQSLQFDPIYEQGNGKGQLSFGHMLENMKSLLRREEDEKQLMAVENMVVSTLFEQLKSESAELESEKRALEKEYKAMTEQFTTLQMVNHELKEMNEGLKLEVSQGDRQTEELRAELETQHSKLDSLQDSYASLQAENFKMVQENNSLQQKFLYLKKEMDELEGENSNIIQETVSLASLSSVYESLALQKGEELESLSVNIGQLGSMNSGLSKKNEMLEKMMELKDSECSELIETVKKLKRESEEYVAVREKLEMQIAELMSANSTHKAEAEQLHAVNDNLESEVCTLREAIEEHRIREEAMSVELQERSNEFELWEAEASSFYFYLQVSSIREILLENKVHELSAVCANLEDEKATKDLEIQQMFEKFGPLESEIQGLKSQLAAAKFGPLESEIQGLKSQLAAAGDQNQKDLEMAFENDEPIVTTMDGISDFLEMLPRVKTVEKAIAEEKEKLETREKVRSRRRRSSRGDSFNKNEIKPEDHSTDSARLQKNICEISEVKKDILMKDIQLDHVPGNNSSSRRRSKRSVSRASDPMLEICDLAENCNIPVAEKGTQSLTRNRSRSSKQKSCSSVPTEKEVGIDKLEVPSSNTTTKQPSKRKKHNGEIMDRLTSDAKKLTSLHTTVRDMKTKLETTSKKATNTNIEKAKTRLLEVEEAIAQLAEGNDLQMKDAGERSSSSPEGASFTSTEEMSKAESNEDTEQTRDGSEKVERMEFEVQTIRHLLLTLNEEDEKKNNNKKTKVQRFYGSRTGVLLRDFVSGNGKTRSLRRKKKGCFYGCGRPATTEE